ncbi:MAG: methylglutaconyl-CoA hydratase [Psychromonas sp.]|jgi:methylglutaconyl-CoA hydratase
MYSLIKTSMIDNVLTITLNRPEKRNAFTPNMLAEIANEILRANRDRSIWVVVFKAEGTIFCAGMDLRFFENPDLEIQNENTPKTEKSLGEIVGSLNKPSIAILSASVYAGGFLLVGECDFVLATPEVTFSLPEVRRGIFPFQVMQTLKKSMSQKKVMEWCISSKVYKAEEAYKDGLVTQIVPRIALDFAEKELIDRIKMGSPFAILKGMETCKEMFDESKEISYPFLKNELEKLKKSEDTKEGLLAFKEKRKPIWKNK